MANMKCCQGAGLMMLVLATLMCLEACTAFVIGGNGVPRGLKVLSPDHHPDLYSILGVSSTANEREIRRAFRSKARRHHPDKKKGKDKDIGEFEVLSYAAETLTDPKKRRNYDLCGLEGVDSGCSFAAKKKHLMRTTGGSKQGSASGGDVGGEGAKVKGVYAYCEECCKGEWGEEQRKQCQAGPCRDRASCRAA